MTHPLVMPELDPSIHAALPTLGYLVDCLVKPMTGVELEAERW
jgi:hypothetical protein